MSYYDIDRRAAGLIVGTGTTATGSVGYPPGEKTTGEYVVSGFPFVSGSTSLTTGVYDKFDIRTKSLFVKPGSTSKAYSVMAGLTAIPTGSIASTESSTYWGV